MPPAGGKRTPLTQLAREPIASYTWGGWGTQNDITQFREVFQPDQGIFSPSYPLVPPEREPRDIVALGQGPQFVKPDRLVGAGRVGRVVADRKIPQPHPLAFRRY